MTAFVLAALLGGEGMGWRSCSCPASLALRGRPVYCIAGNGDEPGAAPLRLMADLEKSMHQKLHKGNFLCSWQGMLLSLLLCHL